MSREHECGIESKAAIFKHPLHPVAIPYPIAFLSAALLTDIIFIVGQNIFWAQASFWLILGGLVMGILAGLLGFIDFASSAKIRDHIIAWYHFIGNVLVMLLALSNFFIRRGDIQEAVFPSGIILSAVTAALLIFAGWYGGELSYRHKIGVIKEH